MYGYCFVGGNDLVLMSDMVIVVDDVVFGFLLVCDFGVLLNNMWMYYVGL